MTRFMMTIDEAVDLVQYAFDNGVQGDIFVKKSPASTIHDIAEAVCEILGVECRLRTIGTRHGEKLYETLVSSEEMAHAIDQGKYYRLPADTRDLNYSLYETDGSKAGFTDYTSHNTRRLNLEETVELLRPLCLQ